MKILLVDPPGKNKGFNTGLGYLAAVLKKEHQVHVLDLNNISMGLCGDPNPDLTDDEVRRRIYDAIDDLDPDIFGVSTKTFTAQTAATIFRYAKQRKREMFTIAGGPHITLDGKKYVNETGIDFGIIGEGESSLPALCNLVRDGKDKSLVSGLLYRRDGRIIKNEITPAYMELNELKFPDYTIFSSVKENGGIMPQYPILTSRGCPFSCAYCSMPQIMGRKWRSHSPEYVISELKHAKEKYSSNSFTVVDDNFTLDLKRVEAITDDLISSRLSLKWNSQNGIRADRITDFLARKMKQSGCQHVWIGIESADEEVFNKINKGEKLADVCQGIMILKGAGIRVGGFFIVGLPHSTRDSDLKSVAFVKKLKIDAWWFNFVPYPHTKAWDWVQANGKILRPIDGALQFGSTNIEPVFDTEEYPKNDRMKTYDEIHIKMKYFDRLIDPSLSKFDKWKQVIEKVRPHGLGALFSLLLFILKYNIRLVKKRVLKLY